MASSLIAATLVMCLVAQAASHSQGHSGHLDDHHHHHHHDEAHDDEVIDSSTTKPLPPAEKGEALMSGHRCIHEQMIARAPKPVTIPQSYLVEHAWKDWSIQEEQPLIEKQTAENPGSAHRVFRATSTDYANMRFKFYFNVDNVGICPSVGTIVQTYQGGDVNCTSSDVLTPLKNDYIVNTLMPQASNFLRGALKVIPINGSLIAPATCNGITIPTSHRTTGVSDADFVAYVTSVPLLDNSSGTVAWAVSCANDASGRPIAGHVNFVPAALKNAATLKTYITAQDVNTGIHELSHALGFSASYFDAYVDLNGVHQGAGGRTQNVNMPNLGKTVTMMTSPRALAAGKEFFQCSTMTGVEIEDQGGPGTGGSHWEKRILYTEYMSGILSSVATYISSLTLGYFEDKGYYVADYSWAQNGSMAFGKGRGCSFVNNKCNTQTGLSEFCFDSTKTNQYCSTDFLGQGQCGVAEYNDPLSSHYQYFSNPNSGGAVALSDYCPTGLTFSNRVCIDGSTKDTQDIYGNTYGSASKCFQSSLVSQGYSPGDAAVSTRCFPISCTSAGRIQIDIRGGTAICPLDGSAGAADLSGVSGYTGVILCPRASALCVSPAATAAPTPAPPTPIPTPAPPGQTPAPAPFTRNPQPATTLPTNCANRVLCANNINVRLPWCRSLADAVLACFGANCDTELASWLSTNGASCTEPFSWGNANCVEGANGGAAMCALLNIV
jgi:leishmanolysin